jgi:1,4-alpha-glucan branching enzyme
MSVGSFCLVLHGHVPYVLRHGTWPHGEDWLYEAAAETYLPLLAAIRECEFLNGNPRLTLGLTPILLEQLAHDDFKCGFEHYLMERRNRAISDRGDFEKADNPHFAFLAGRWEEWYRNLAEEFSRIGGNIPGAFAECARRGLVEILTSSATHAYLPLLYEDASVYAQVRAGIASSERILGFKPSGMWLPECAYRPPGPWHAPIPWGQPRNRMGTEQFAANEGVDYFFIENQLIEHSRSEWINNGGWHKVDWEEALKYPNRGWRSVQEPVLVASDGTSPGRVTAFARDPSICEKVWSGMIGYPADGVYLEFHKKHGERRGLRYWKITGPRIDLGAKQPYYPQDISGKIHEHATHFCNAVKQRLHEYHNRTGRYGMVVASFDAELFGHWWFEGPKFLQDVLLTLNTDPDVDLCTPPEYLEWHPPDKAATRGFGKTTG